MMSMTKLSVDIQAIRTDYGKASLDVQSVDKNPLHQFKHWLNDAITAKVLEPNAMNLITIALSGFPTSRIVLLRDVKESGFTFFSNYQSEKGREIEKENRVGLNFFWPELERQVRVAGLVTKLSASESDLYFASRPRKSQIGAWASNQSEPIKSREILELKELEFEAKYLGVDVPRPPHWGGYVVVPEELEFWQGRPSRLHDRLKYTLTNGSWEITRLSP